MAARTLSESDLVTLLKGSLLGRRRQSSIRYRLRNISAILADHGFPVLTAYSPAPRAGTGVRAKLETMLFSETPVDYARHSLGLDPADQTSPEAVLEQAEMALKAALNEFERLHQGSTPIGHNKPPEPIDGLTVEDFHKAISILEASRVELAAARLTAKTAARQAGALARFGTRAAAWAGERLTRAADAGLEAGVKLAARLCVVAIFASLPPVAAAIEMLVRLANG